MDLAATQSLSRPSIDFKFQEYIDKPDRDPAALYLIKSNRYCHPVLSLRTSTDFILSNMGDFIQKIEVPDSVTAGSGLQSSVKRYPLTGIDVLVVGAGVGGLTAALECYRKGHNDRIFERELSISAAGEYPINIPTSLLKLTPRQVTCFQLV